MARVGRQRVNGDGRQDKKFVRQPYSYEFKLQVIDYYDSTDIASTVARFFLNTIDSTKSSKRKLVSKWKQQRAHIEQFAQRASTAQQLRFRLPGLVTTLPPMAEASIVKWINDFRRDGVPVSVVVLRLPAAEEVRELGLPLNVFAASWQ